jgi:hypothetical protein
MRYCLGLDAGSESLILWGIASHLESLAHMRAKISRRCSSSGRDKLGMGSSNSYGQIMRPWPNGDQRGLDSNALRNWLDTDHLQTCDVQRRIDSPHIIHL